MKHCDISWPIWKGNSLRKLWILQSIWHSTLKEKLLLSSFQFFFRSSKGWCHAHWQWSWFSHCQAPQSLQTLDANWSHCATWYIHRNPFSLSFIADPLQRMCYRQDNRISQCNYWNKITYFTLHIYKYSSYTSPAYLGGSIPRTESVLMISK